MLILTLQRIYYDVGEVEVTTTRKSPWHDFVGPPNDLKHKKIDPLIGNYLNVGVAVSSPCTRHL